MAPRYQRDELLRLRASKLVCRPSGLPSQEEWMGPPPETNARKDLRHKVRAEESTTHHDSTNGRPSLSQISRPSSNVTEDIVLGPPKTAFVSARTPIRPSFTTNNDESNRNNRYISGDRPTKDKNRRDIEGESSKEPRAGHPNNRRGGKEDGDSWSNARRRKSFGAKEVEQSNRVTDDRGNSIEKDSSRTHQSRGSENHKRENDRSGANDHATQRNAPARGRGEPSWYKDDDRKENERPARDWRDKERGGQRGTERAWNRAEKVEQNPEWMDEPDLEPEEKQQAHTQADFERWKERMKANPSNTPTEDIPSTPTQPQPDHQRTTSGVNGDKENRKPNAPLILNSNVDKFFGLWNDPVNSRDSGHGDNEDQPPKDSVKTPLPKSSKFTGFFNPRSEPQTRQKAPTPPTSVPLGLQPDASSEDKEGFQRILQMLGGGNTSTMNSMPVEKVKTPPEERFKKAPASPPLHSPRSRRSGGLEALLGPQLTQDENTQPNRDSEFLLKLMQQARSAPTQQNSNEQNQKSVNAAGTLPFSRLFGQPRETPQQHNTPGPFSPRYENERRAEPQVRDKLNPNAPTDRTYAFDDQPSLHLQQRQPQFHGPSPNPFSPPPGFQRPPGFDQAPSLYPHPHMQAQRPSMTAPPPGFQPPTLRTQQQQQHQPPQSQYPPGLMPGLSNLNLNTEPHGAPPQFQIRAQHPQQGSLQHGLPFPGNVNGPPPGFPPPMHFGQEPGGAGRINENDRMFMPQRNVPDVFGDIGFGGGRGLPQAFRRQE